MGPEHDERTADVSDMPPPAEDAVCLVTRIMEDVESVLGRAFLPAIPAPEYDNTSRAMRAAEIPATIGHTNARALAKVYSALLCEPEGTAPLLGAEALARCDRAPSRLDR
ncbi:MAG: hypothetical protein OXT09_02560 [Myxococcales bacterium]|nr:hypothetical protein [Myxococcales bacterium]